MTAHQTPYDEDIRELIVEARDAICKLLDEFDHDAWLDLRIGYGHLRGALTRDEGLREQEERKREKDERWEDKLEAEHDSRDAWGRLSAAARESLLLQVLGDERLIIRQLTSRLNAQLGYPGKPCALYDSHTRSLVKRMLGAGQLERDPETFNKTHTRYRYFRKRGLDGPIVDLERTYQEGGDA